MIEKFSYKGQWFLPENPEKKINGILTFDPNEGINLELFDTFFDTNSIEEYHEIDFILGITSENKNVTLYDSFEYNRLSLVNKPISKYISNYILVGDHYSNEEEFMFDNITGRFKNLDEWIGEFGFKIVDPDLQNRKVTVNYEQPNPIKFEINKELRGEFNFVYRSHLTRNTPTVTIEQKSEILLESSIPKSFESILDDLLLFQNFLTLGTFETSYPISIWLSNKERKNNNGVKEIVSRVQLFHKQNLKFTDVKDKFRFEFLFHYRDISPNFELIIQKWYSLSTRISPVTYLLFESLKNRKFFNENKFLNIVQSLETFHRRFRVNEILPKKEHQLRTNEIVESVDKKYKQWLKEKLNFSNEPTLHYRLDSIIEELQIFETIKKIINNKEKFIKDIKNSRNYYTHYDPKLEKKSIKGNDLYFYTEKLRVLLITIVLLETGLENEQINIFFERNEFRFFNHIIN